MSGLLRLFLCLCLLTAYSYGQTPTSSPEFYEGTAEGESLDAARISALNNLGQQVQVFISATFKFITVDKDTAVQQSVVASTVARSALGLRDVQEVVERVGNRYRVRKYVSRTSVAEMFAQRRLRILELLRNAEQELAVTGIPVNIGLVLKNYYWALLLAEIHPDKVMFTPAGSTTPQLVITWIPAEIESVSKGVVVKPEKWVKDEGTVWHCSAQYRSKPISGLQYEYFDGVGQTIGDVIGGQTTMTLFFKDDSIRAKECELIVEYRNREEMDELLRLADSVSADRRLKTNIRVEFPRTAPPRLPDLPRVIQELERAGESTESLLKALNTFESHSRIVSSNSSRFESLEGLYGLVLNQSGLELILRCEKGTTIEARSGAHVHLTGKPDRRIIWVEVLE